MKNKLKEHILQIIIRADSDLSFLIHRGGIKWNNFDDEFTKENLQKTVDQLRQLTEDLKQGWL